MSSASSSSGDSDFNYIGTHTSSDEGTRHFFMLRSVYSRYTAINGNKVDRFMVYTSTGVNTRGICGTRLCIIPCFGTMIKWVEIPEDFRKSTGSSKRHALISPIIKIDFFKGIKPHIQSNTKLLERYTQLQEMFLASESISQDLLREFFNDVKGEIDLSEYRDLRVKVGSNFFLKDVTVYRDRIYKYVQEGEKKMFEDLSYLNQVVGVNNFYGIDLSKLPPYKDLMTQCIEKYKPDYPYFCTVPELFVGNKAPEAYKQYTADVIREILKRLKNDKNKGDKYLALINSPPENTIYIELLKQNRD